MAMPRETSSSQTIRRDCRFHRAALAADPRTEQLVPATKAVEEALKLAERNTEAKEEERIEKLATLLRTDFELDDLTRKTHREVLVAADDDRQSPLYRGAFPNGLSALVGLRGEEQARATMNMVDVLEERAPEIAKKHGPTLEQLTERCVEAESAWRDSESAAAQAFGEERIARAVLIQQMQKNEGALLTIYPGQRRRVRSYFRPAHRRSAAPDTGAPESSEENVE